VTPPPAPPPPPPIFQSDRSLGYNCSNPEQGVGLLDQSYGAPPAAASVMNAPVSSGLYNAWPRRLCPTADDSDGLRFLYPECDEMLPCETLGGSEHRTEVNQSWGTGCHRWVPTHTGYNIVDYYVPTPQNNWSHVNYTWQGLPFGRALPAAFECVRDFNTRWGKVGLFRALLIFYRAVFPTMLILALSKLLCMLLLRMPCLKATRQRNEKLMRTALKRKAEVRRMSEGGQEFAVKQAAKQTGQLEASTEVMQHIKSSTTHNAVKAKRIDAAANLKQSIAKKKSVHSSSAAAYGVDMSMRADSPSAENEEAAGVGVSGGGRGNRVAPAPVPAVPAAPRSMAEELRAMTAQAQSDAASEDAQ